MQQKFAPFVWFVILAWWSGDGGATSAHRKKPNIVFMLIDDLGWNDMGWNDQFGQIHSPKIDALRADSIALDQYYVYRFCSPSRSTFMTGRYPWHIGQHTSQNLNPMPGIACGINLEYDFIAKVLKKEGYATYALGKQHLGFMSKKYTPTYRGFDHYLGYYSGAEEHFTHEKTGTGDEKSKAFTAYDLANNTGEAVSPCLGPVGNASATYSSYLYGNESLRILDSHDPKTPLYMYLAWNNVHAPNEAPDTYMNLHKRIRNKGRQGLAAMVSALDDQLTAVVDKLKEKSMWDNTLLVFSTDNGGNLGGSGSNWPLRGGKYTFWQGGVRGLGFVGGGLVPDHLRGTTYDGFIHAADWYTTFAALAGASVKETGPVPPDGIDVSKALLTNSTSPRKEVVVQIISNSSGNLHALPPPEFCRHVNGTDAYQHCIPPTDGLLFPEKVMHKNNGEIKGIKCGVLIQGQYKLIWGYPGWTNKKWNGWLKPPSQLKANDDSASSLQYPCSLASPCLFDIIADPTEHHNIASAHEDVVNRMKSRILELLKGEVTLQASGLCPTKLGTKPDPAMTRAARKVGFWVPWLV